MYCKVHKGFSTENWENSLFQNEHGSINDQIKYTIKRGCKVYIRRARFDTPITVKDAKIAKNGKSCDTVVNCVSEMKSLLRQTYDYAWNKRNVSGQGRYVKKEGFELSNIL